LTFLMSEVPLLDGVRKEWGDCGRKGGGRGRTQVREDIIIVGKRKGSVVGERRGSSVQGLG